MRILMLSQFYPPIIGGEERHVKNLATALAQRGHEVCVATLSGTGSNAQDMDGGVRVYRLHGTLQKMTKLFSEGERRHVPPFPDPGLLLGLRRVILEFRPDIVHAHNWLLHSFLPLKQWSGARFVVTLHDLSLVCAKKNMMHGGSTCSGPAFAKCMKCASHHYGPIKGCVTAAANWVSQGAERKLADKFLTVSSAIAVGNKLAQSGVDYEIIPNFVPDDIAQLDDEPPAQVAALPQEPFLLFAGDLGIFKGTHVLIDAYRRLRNAPPLVMIGRRSAETPEDLPENVHIFESWPHAAVMHAWNRSLLGVVPSILPEACATVVMECMGMGKTLVATRIGGTPDLVEDGISALLVPPGNADALSCAIQTLIDNPSQRERMESAAVQRVQHLKAKSVVPRIENIYAQLLAGKSKENCSIDHGYAVPP
ncbi:MAG: glycosyltransferase family 4 protein [Hyphomicrobium sp.]